MFNRNYVPQQIKLKELQMKIVSGHDATYHITNWLLAIYSTRKEFGGNEELVLAIVYLLIMQCWCLEVLLNLQLR